MPASRAAVLGSPIAHSLSPVLHRAAYRALGLTGWTYDAIECDAPGLPGLLDSLGPEWAGLSLTMPLKRAVLPLLDVSDPLVAQVGAANTVVFSGGARYGYNTDVPGIATALSEAGESDLAAAEAGQSGEDHAENDAVATAEDEAGATAEDEAVATAGNEAVATAGNVLILGGGATACSALAAAHSAATIAGRRKRPPADSFVVAVRDKAKAGPLLEIAGRLGVTVRLTRFGTDLPSRRWRLLISTVPAGAADIFADQISSGALAADTVLDVVYHPWPTSLAAAAELAGSTVVGGFELLLHQAAVQVELMTGQPAPTAIMRAAGQAELARRIAG